MALLNLDTAVQQIHLPQIGLSLVSDFVKNRARAANGKVNQRLGSRVKKMKVPLVQTVLESS